MSNLKELDEGQENFLLLNQLSFLESDQEIEELVQTLGLQRPLIPPLVVEPLHLQVDSFIQYSVYLLHECPSEFDLVCVIHLGAFQVPYQLCIADAVFAQTNTALRMLKPCLNDQRCQKYLEEVLEPRGLQGFVFDSRAIG